jgi:hypothetical protein
LARSVFMSFLFRKRRLTGSIPRVKRSDASFQQHDVALAHHDLKLFSFSHETHEFWNAASFLVDMFSLAYLYFIYFANVNIVSTFYQPSSTPTAHLPTARLCFTLLLNKQPFTNLQPLIFDSNLL